MKNSEQQKRSQTSLAPLFSSTSDKNIHSLILTSSSDEGVKRNLGRNGSRYAPKAILNVLKKFNNHNIQDSILTKEVTSIHGEKEDFELAQKSSANEISKAIGSSNAKSIVHLGGGHDHVYPLLLSLNKSNYENILIINIDAHCDTRIDDKHHSGTPFRNYDLHSEKNFHLIQYGIHSFANSTQTLTELKNGTSETFFFNQLKEKSNYFTCIPKDLLFSCPFELNEKTMVILSLDADAIEGHTMQAVSAVNPVGIPLNHVFDLIKLVKQLNSPNIFGIYEYNPVYDNLSQLGSRSISSLIYEYINLE